jgi:hypothetical protein
MPADGPEYLGYDVRLRAARLLPRSGARATDKGWTGGQAIIVELGLLGQRGPLRRRRIEIRGGGTTDAEAREFDRIRVQSGSDAYSEERFVDHWKKREQNEKG